jgi:hypothetical protein
MSRLWIFLLCKNDLSSTLFEVLNGEIRMMVVVFYVERVTMDILFLPGQLIPVEGVRRWGKYIGG